MTLISIDYWFWLIFAEVSFVPGSTVTAGATRVCDRA